MWIFYYYLGYASFLKQYRDTKRISRGTAAYKPIYNYRNMELFHTNRLTTTKPTCCMEPVK